MPIFDQGYQHWQGPLSGHAWRWWAIARNGTRVQTQNRLTRFLLLVSWLPAIALVVAVALWGLVEQKSKTMLDLAGKLLPAAVFEDLALDPAIFRSAVWTVAYSTFFKVEMFFIMLLVVAAGPGLISRDLRFNALPLYFARPLTRLDYFLGKLGVIGTLVAWVAVGPAVFAYIVGVSFSLNLGVVKDTYHILLASIAFGLVVTLSAGTLMLALSSLSKRSVYVGITWAGLWLISSSVGSFMSAFHRESAIHAAREEQMAAWVAEHPPPPKIQMHGKWPQNPEWTWRQGQLGKGGVKDEQQKAAERWFQEWNRANMELSMAVRQDQGEMARDDWRPLCSYVANLERLADALLRTDAAWVTFGKALAKPRAIFGAGFNPFAGRPAKPPSERQLANHFVPQFPWYWSAGVLAALLGLSVWILSIRIKSLDSLR
jgi:ABC-type transport system involved in multi-copper enzyme maturation permease subunit